MAAEYLCYGDILDQLKAELERYTKEKYQLGIELVSSSIDSIETDISKLQSGIFPDKKHKDYTLALNELFETYGQDQVETVANQLREELVESLTKLGIEPGIFSQSATWLYWDLAKQLAMLKDPSAQDTKHYRYVDPMKDKEKQEELVNRHLGWELYAGGKGVLLIEGDNPSRPELAGIIDSAEPSIRDEIKELLATKPNVISGGRKDMPSYKLARLGQLVRGLI